MHSKDPITTLTREDIRAGRYTISPTHDTPFKFLSAGSAQLQLKSGASFDDFDPVYVVLHYKGCYKIYPDPLV